MAKTKTYYSNKYDNRQLRLELTQVPNIANNTSTINWKFISEGNTSDATLYLVCATTIKINGEQVYYKGLTNWYGTGTAQNPHKTFPACEGSVSGSVTVKHNADGSLSIPVYFKTAVFTSAQHKDYGGTWELDDIPRGATLSAADNFTDEGNPAISYSNPAGTAVSALDVSIYDTAGRTPYAAYRAASTTGTSYTFNLTDAERTTLRKAATGNTLNVKFYIRTTIAGNTFYSSIQKTMTIINGNPTLNPTVVDTNATTKALTGDANKLVRYYSNAYYTIGAAALKEATLKSQKATHKGVAQTTATGTFNAIENASFTFEAKDSRGNTTTKTITKTLINYVKLTCNQKVTASVDGKALILISGNYFNGSFGSVANTLTVQYRYKTSSGTYSAWTAATATLTDNYYSASVSLSDLDYQAAYVFQCRAVDKLATVETPELKTKALPVFDWGEDDFAFNVPISIEGNPLADYVIDTGISGDWYYRKWNTGKIEFWYVYAENTAVATAYGNGYYNGATLSITLPTDLISSTTFPVININAQGGNAAIYDATIAGYNATTRKISFYITSMKSQSAVDVYLHFHVIGRWNI